MCPSRSLINWPVPEATRPLLVQLWNCRMFPLGVGVGVGRSICSFFCAKVKTV